MMMKKTVSRAYESPLSEDIWFEWRMLHATFALQHQQVGMSAFVGKRIPEFQPRCPPAPARRRALRGLLAWSISLVNTNTLTYVAMSSLRKVMAFLRIFANFHRVST